MSANLSLTQEDQSKKRLKTQRVPFRERAHPLHFQTDKTKMDQRPEDKIHRLKGPGVWDEPGAAHMGGKTPIRLAELCSQYMDNLDEYSLYKVICYGFIA